MNKVVIDIKGVNRFYDEFHALKNISFQVKKGQIFGYLGPNGSGKTTTIKMILGLMRPSSGSLSVLDGNPFLDTSSGLKLRSNIGSMLEFNGLIEDISGIENLVFWAGLYGMDKKLSFGKAKKMIEKLKLEKWSNFKVSKYSYGMKKRLTLARSLISDPDLLILDEPTMGIDPESRYLIRKILKELKNQGKTIFFSSHDLEEVQKVCTHVAIIKKGKIRFNGSLNDLIEHFGRSKLYVRLKSSKNAKIFSNELKKRDYETKVDGPLVIFYPELNFNLNDFQDYEIVDSWNGNSSLEETYLEIVGT